MDPLVEFHPLVGDWFRATHGHPTPPQAQGWPSIASGQNTLILAPTGSGKTLAAFLWAINHLVDQRLAAAEGLPHDPGVRILYISPLKALNNDIERNLRVPLRGIHDLAQRRGIPLPPLTSAVRTGDTPSSTRERMITTPPDILITTPESLYLMLTARRPRAIFRTVQYVIVDEIHALCANKRGVHLSLSLERLQEIAEQEFVRIGLSATQKPLETVAAFLGGMAPLEGSGHTPRPVNIIDTGGKKSMDVRVLCPVSDFSALSDEGAWPDVYDALYVMVQEHRNTLIFVNNRRLAERIAARLNEMALGAPSTGATGMTNLYAVPRPTLPAQPLPEISTEPPPLAQAYHGSMAREAREAMEEALKAGALRVLVATSSLELGIDIGAIDLVIQVQSPKGIARGLQRIGRSGHLVHATSKGRIVPTHRDDLLEAAVIARRMAAQDVESIAVPENCLDVLAQQLVAMTAAEDVPVDHAFGIIRRAYPYRALPRSMFDAVLAMISGSYAEEAFHDLRARISWDRSQGMLRALPGTSHLAITSGGTISDRGYYGVYLSGSMTKLGEVDEEFIYESRTGDTFMLGSSVWRITAIDANRVLVDPAPGQPARMPFWKGEGIGRSYAVGALVGEFRRELAGRLTAPDCIPWLMRDFSLDESGAWNILDYVRRQVESTGVVPSDRTLLVESFLDEIGDPRVVVHSPFGRRVNGLLGMLLGRRMRDLTGVEAQTLPNDEGVLIRTAEGEDIPADLLRGMTAEEARSIVLEEVLHSALFAGHFRQNAGRALLMPRPAPGRRTPLWVQRLKAADLLQLARAHQDFPLVLETLREVMSDVLDLPRFLEIITRITTGAIEVATIAHETPSPFAASLLFDFVAVSMYAGDTSPEGRAPSGSPLSPNALHDILPDATIPGTLRPDAVALVEEQLQHAAPGYQARSAEELMQLLLRLGDLSTEEITARSAGNAAGMIEELAHTGRIVRLQFGDEERWVAAEHRALYADLESEEHAQSVLRRYLQGHGPVTGGVLARRYGIGLDRIAALEARWVNDRHIVRTRHDAPANTSYAFRPNIERMQRQSIALRRKEIIPCTLAEFSGFLQAWTGFDTGQRIVEDTGMGPLLEQMAGLPLPLDTWERDILRPRTERYAGTAVRALARDGSVVWAGAGTGRAFPFSRGQGALYALAPAVADPAAARILTALQEHGASFFSDVRTATGLSLHALNAALAELFWQGAVSNDAFDELLALRRSSRAPEGPIDRIQIVDPLRNPARSRLLGTARKALRQVPGWNGRWFLLGTPGVAGSAVPREEAAEWQARLLLDRYGVVTREVLNHERLLPWSTLAPVFQRMELRGDVRRGYFVEGISGIQYALPAAADDLASRRGRRLGAPGVRLVSTLDPASPYGPGIALRRGGREFRVGRTAGSYLAVCDGAPFLLLEADGARLTTIGEADEALMEQALREFTALLALPAPLRPFSSIHMEFWDGIRPAASPFAGLLKKLGFDRDRDQTVRGDAYSLR